MFYRPKGNFSFLVTMKVDDLPPDSVTQSFAFNQISGLDLLGETFILGNSILGSSAGFAPFTFTTDGIGRGITLEVRQTSANEQIELWGFAIEYEPADIEQEVKGE